MRSELPQLPGQSREASLSPVGPEPLAGVAQRDRMIRSTLETIALADSHRVAIHTLADRSHSPFALVETIYRNEPTQLESHARDYAVFALGHEPQSSRSAAAIAREIDVRILLAVGFAVVAFSSWQMTRYDLTIPESSVIWPSVVQGVGLGLLFVPLATAAFATLSPELRADGTAIFSLLRNIGSAIGISVAQSQLVRNTQIAHAGLVENLGNNNGNVLTSPVGTAFHLSTLPGVASLNAEITRQATMIAYRDDFRLMLIVTVAVIPLLLMMRPPRRDSTAAATSMALE